MVMQDIGIYVEIAPFRGYVQLAKLEPAPGYHIRSFERGTTDPAGFIAANTGTYTLSQLYSQETSIVKMSSVWPLRTVYLKISPSGFGNAWSAVCDSMDLCEKGKDVVASLVQ